jgi:ElaB/YqjD/DUF883 family membrane-anchored ribosome-binding protein
MKTTVDEAKTKRDADARADNTRRLEEEEMAKRIEKGIEDAKAAISETLEDGKAAAERLLKQGRYAMEDGLSELTHNVKRHPLSFLGLAFAAGAVFGALLSLAAHRTKTTPSE